MFAYPLRRLGLVLALLVAAHAPGVAAAQPTQADLTQARELFVQGTQALESNHWDDAAALFGRSYALSEVPAALFNQGVALRSVGRAREARDAFRRLLHLHASALSADMRRDAEQAVTETQARLGTLLLLGLLPERRYRIRVDATAVEDDGQRPMTLELNAGQHTVSVRSDGSAPYLWEGPLAEGQRMEVEVELVPLLPTVSHAGSAGSGQDPRTTGDERAGARDHGDDGGSVFSSPVFWTIVAAVVIGGGVAAGFVIHDNAQLDPRSQKVVNL